MSQRTDRRNWSTEQWINQTTREDIIQAFLNAGSEEGDELLTSMLKIRRIWDEEHTNVRPYPEYPIESSAYRNAPKVINPREGKPLLEYPFMPALIWILGLESWFIQARGQAHVRLPIGFDEVHRDFADSGYEPPVLYKQPDFYKGDPKLADIPLGDIMAVTRSYGQAGYANVEYDGRTIVDYLVISVSYGASRSMIELMIILMEDGLMTKRTEFLNEAVRYGFNERGVLSMFEHGLVPNRETFKKALVIKDKQLRWYSLEFFAQLAGYLSQEDYTGLYIVAINENRLDVALLLVENDEEFDPDFEDTDGRNSLIILAHETHNVRYHQSRGRGYVHDSPMYLDFEGSELEAKNLYNQRVAIWENSYKRLIEALYLRGVDFLKVAKDGSTILHYINDPIMYNYVVALMRERSIDLVASLNTANYWGITPLGRMMYENLDMAKLYIEDGADIDLIQRLPLMPFYPEALALLEKVNRSRGRTNGTRYEEPVVTPEMYVQLFGNKDYSGMYFRYLTNDWYRLLRTTSVGDSRSSRMSIPKEFQASEELNKVVLETYGIFKDGPNPVMQKIAFYDETPGRGHSEAGKHPARSTEEVIGNPWLMADLREELMKTDRYFGLWEPVK